MVEASLAYQVMLSPPVVFVLMLVTIAGLARVLSKCAFKRKDAPGDIGKPYACGEDAYNPLIQPDYSQFFPFAFFFTLFHVVALMMATVPVETAESFVIAIVYVIGALVGLFILYRQ